MVPAHFIQLEFILFVCARFARVMKSIRRMRAIPAIHDVIRRAVAAAKADKWLPDIPSSTAAVKRTFSSVKNVRETSNNEL